MVTLEALSKTSFKQFMSHKKPNDDKDDSLVLLKEIVGVEDDDELEDVYSFPPIQKQVDTSEEIDEEIMHAYNTGAFEINSEYSC